MQTLTIDRLCPTPVYRQVANQLRQGITAGELQAGSQLPSVRELARDLGVSLNTVARAYRLLEGEGFLVIRDRSGVTVAAPATAIELPARDGLVDQLRVTLSRLRQAGMPTEELLAVTEKEVLAMDAGQDGRRNE